MRYALVIEKAEGNYSAYGPDLPGCVATGATVAEVKAEIREAIVFHVEGLREDGMPIPNGARQVEYVVFAFHDGEELGLRMLARLAKHTGLTPEDL